MPFSSHRITSRLRAIYLITSDVDLGPLAKVMLVRFLHCKFTLSLSFLSAIFLKNSLK